MLPVLLVSPLTLYKEIFLIRERRNMVYLRVPAYPHGFEVIIQGECFTPFYPAVKSNNSRNRSISGLDKPHPRHGSFSTLSGKSSKSRSRVPRGWFLARGCNSCLVKIENSKTLGEKEQGVFCFRT